MVRWAIWFVLFASAVTVLVLYAFTDHDGLAMGMMAAGLATGALLDWRYPDWWPALRENHRRLALLGAVLLVAGVTVALTVDTVAGAAVGLVGLGLVIPLGGGEGRDTATESDSLGGFGEGGGGTGA